MRGWRGVIVLALSAVYTLGCGSSQDTAEDTTPQPVEPVAAEAVEPPPPEVVEALGLSLTVPSGLTRMEGPPDMIGLAPPGTTQPPPPGTPVIVITSENLDEELRPSAMGCATLLSTSNAEMSFNPARSPTGFEASGVLGCEAEGTVTMEGGQLIAGYQGMLLEPTRFVIVMAMARLGEQEDHFQAARDMVRAIRFTTSATPAAPATPAATEAPATE